MNTEQQKPPRVRWFKVKRASSGRWHTMLGGATVTSHLHRFLATFAASLFNAKVARLVAARDKRRAR